MSRWRRRPPDFSGRLAVTPQRIKNLGRRIGRAGAGTHGLCLRLSTVDSPCALLVDIAASVRVSGRRFGRHTASTPETHTPSRQRRAPAEHARDKPPTPSTRRLSGSRHTGGGGPPGGFGGGFGGNVFPTPGEETGFFFMLPKKELGHAEREDDPQDQEEPQSGKAPQARPARPEARHRPEPDQGLLQGLLRLLARRGLRDLRREYRLDEEVKTVVSYYPATIMLMRQHGPGTAASRKTRPPRARARSRRRGSL